MSHKVTVVTPSFNHGMDPARLGRIASLVTE